MFGNCPRHSSHSHLRRLLNKISRELPAPSPAHFSSTRTKVEEPESEKCCRLVFISDTHSVHGKLGSLPAGDVLIHAGDFSMARPAKPGEYKDFFDWFVGQPHQHKILISGNRDQLMDSAAKVRLVVRLSHSFSYLQHKPAEIFWTKQIQEYVKGDSSVVYLEDEGHVINIDEEFRISLYGSPWTAIHGKPGKAFQIGRTDLRKKWEKIPASVDILITHMPPYGLLDENAGKVKAGCRDLLRLVTEKLRPQIHVFGHIHESRGWTWLGKTLFINASISRGALVNSPIVVDYYRKTRKLEISQ